MCYSKENNNEKNSKHNKYTNPNINAKAPNSKGKKTLGH